MVMAGHRHGDPDAVVGQWRNGRLGIKSQAEIEADRRAELRIGETGEDPHERAGPFTVNGDANVIGGLLQVGFIDNDADVVVIGPYNYGGAGRIGSFIFRSVAGGTVFEAYDSIGRAVFAFDAVASLATFVGDVEFGDGIGGLTIRLDATTGDISTPGVLSVASFNTTANSNLGDSQSDLTTIFGKRTTAGNAPGVAIGAAAGTGASVGAITGNDISGRVVLNTGTSPGTGTLCTVTFNTPYAAAAKNIGANQASATGGVVDLYTTSITASSFVIGCSDAPAASSTITVGWSVD